MFKHRPKKPPRPPYNIRRSPNWPGEDNPWEKDRWGWQEGSGPSQKELDAIKLSEPRVSIHSLDDRMRMWSSSRCQSTHCEGRSYQFAKDVWVECASHSSDGRPPWLCHDACRCGCRAKSTEQVRKDGTRLGCACIEARCRWILKLPRCQM